MIIRQAVACKTCQKPHTLRIGMGQENTQSHAFDCKGCGERIKVRMDVNYEEVSTSVVCEENSELIEEIKGSPIINLDANFLIPKEDQGKDGVFFRMEQTHKMLTEAEAAGKLDWNLKVDPAEMEKRPYRRPDFQSEWTRLRSAWSLTRRGKSTLAEKLIKEASEKLYPRGTVSDLADWCWNFTNILVGGNYNKKMNDALHSLGNSFVNDLGKGFLAWNASVSPSYRADLYIDIFSQFFNCYEEFGQVVFGVVRGAEIEPDHLATSIHFDKVKMFYGNAFESFGSLVEILAILNNLRQGRDFNQFQKLTLDAYRGLDKASKLGPIVMNAPLMELCGEFDNGLRNASHHGRLSFDTDKQLISYGAGKGGTGQVVTLKYAEYLAKCVMLFFQIVILFQLELVFHRPLKLRSPLF